MSADQSAVDIESSVAFQFVVLTFGFVGADERDAVLFNMVEWSCDVGIWCTVKLKRGGPDGCCMFVSVCMLNSATDVIAYTAQLKAQLIGFWTCPYFLPVQHHLERCGASSRHRPNALFRSVRFRK